MNNLLDRMELFIVSGGLVSGGGSHISGRLGLAPLPPGTLPIQLLSTTGRHGSDLIDFCLLHHAE